MLVLQTIEPDMVEHLARLRKASLELCMWGIVLGMQEAPCWVGAWGAHGRAEHGGANHSYCIFPTQSIKIGTVGGSDLVKQMEQLGDSGER